MIPDLIILIASMGLNFFLIPTLRSSQKPPVTTSLGFAILVATIGGALLWAGLWLGGGSNILGGLLWTVVVWQTVRGRKVNG